LLLASLAAQLLQARLNPANPRIAYGLHHLSVELAAAALFTAFVAIIRPALARIPNLANRPTALYTVAVAVVFGLTWLPVWLAGGFAQDDWLLLAAASVRHSITDHPALSWYALDTVDGNFRPLGTVLYFGYLLKWFGPTARVFTLGPLVLTFLVTLTAFAFVRELGYGRPTAAAASLLFLTRGVLYTVVAWASALGDGIAILCCGLTALLVLKATKRSGLATAACHAAAWLLFCVAILGKQSAFVAPLIVALILYLRPGESRSLSPTRTTRLFAAATAFIVYAATAAVVFLHAKSLLHAPSPYPIGLSAKALLQSFAHITWYFLVMQFPDRYPTANLLPSLLGLAILITAIFLVRRHPRLLGDRPRDVLFAALAAAASLSLFVVLGTRSAPYYGCMAAFWISIALAISLTGFAPAAPAARRCTFVFCLLITTGFAGIRIQQTALIPSGGYLWGTFGMDFDRRTQTAMRHQLTAAHLVHPDDTLIITDCPESRTYPSMALLDAPALPRILLYDTHNRAYTANNRLGLRPSDDTHDPADRASLSDPEAYHWTTPLDPTTAAGILARSNIAALACALIVNGSPTGN
jgi:hypothetical protein